jgi:serine/threonine-protein kinase
MFFLLLGTLIGCLLVWVFKWLFRATPAGTRPMSCPSVGQLRDLLAERLPSWEQARLAAHLELCKTCQYRVEGLTAGQKSWPGMARHLSQRPPDPEPALRKVMDRLKENPDSEATRDEPVFAADLPLGFLSPPDKPGQLGRLERYEVQEEIGRGGMGIVLKAFDPSLHRVVAIKVLAPQLATSGVARKRFLREAKAAAAVTHDHIVTIHAVEESNGLPYLVMQYVAGPSLQERIDKEGPLELAEVLRIGMQTASGLAAAHAHGIVHRDIKPANILLEEGVSRVKITDFGLARAMDDASLTQSGFVAGSPLYMAPEQARGEALDHRADLFSLGSVLYTMCTGRPPFRAANTLAVLRRVSEDAPRPIRETNPEIPDWLTAVVEKLMAKDPAERFSSAADVVDVLGQHLAQLQHAAWVPPARSPAPAGTEAGLPTSVTICPSCGASLHVPERMVGTLVHCAECGKPFHVEEGSEVIQVARPVRWPLQPHKPRWRLRGKLPRWVRFPVGCAILLMAPILFFIVVFVSYQSAQQSAPPVTAASKPLQENQPPSFFHLQPLTQGLPPGATLFGAIDLERFGALSLDDTRTQTLLRLVMPRETADRLTPENLGRIRLSNIALGYYEGPKAEMVLRLTGTALDGHKRIVEFLRRNAGGNVQIDELDKKLGANGPVCVSSPELPFALKFVDDHHLYLAAFQGRQAEASQPRKMLDRLPSSEDALSGYHPPWVKNAASTVSSNLCGLFLGEVPAPWYDSLTDALAMWTRVRPRSFVCHLTMGLPPVFKKDQGITLDLTLNADNAKSAAMLRDDLEGWRSKAPETLRRKYPALEKKPEVRALLGQIQRSMHWKAKGESVRTEMHIPASAWKALAELAKR